MWLHSQPHTSLTEVRNQIQKPGQHAGIHFLTFHIEAFLPAFTLSDACKTNQNGSELNDSTELQEPTLFHNHMNLFLFVTQLSMPIPFSLYATHFGISLVIR